MNWSTFVLVATWVAVAIDFVIRIVALTTVANNRRPQTAMAWLLTIFFIPYLGFLAFLLFGSRRLPRGRREKQREINRYIVETNEGMEQATEHHAWPPWLEPIVRLNTKLGAMPLVGGNDARLLPEYQSSLEEMVASIDAAQRYVHAEFYITAWDETTAPFFDALRRAVDRGVTVRLLFDHVASLRRTHYRRTLRKLRETGAEWHAMLPIQPLRGRFQRPDLRNHRKLLVIDGEVAFTGSQNLIDRGYNTRGNAKRGLQWKELMVRFEGPVVAGIDALFATDWYSETDELLLRETEAARRHPEQTLDAQVVPSGPGFEGENNLRLFNSLMYAAHERIIITSPYFVPDETMLYAVTTAAQSGLDVQLFVSEIGDQPLVFHAQRSYYQELLRAGVRIWLYKAPYILHAKHLTIDDEVAVIGSSNMDMRSFSLNLEISVMLRGPEIIESLRGVEASYRAASRELTLEEWTNRSWGSKVLDNIARLTATLQ